MPTKSLDYKKVLRACRSSLKEAHLNDCFTQFEDTAKAALIEVLQHNAKEKGLPVRTYVEALLQDIISTPYKESEREDLCAGIAPLLFSHYALNNILTAKICHIAEFSPQKQVKTPKFTTRLLLRIRHTLSRWLFFPRPKQRLVTDTLLHEIAFFEKHLVETPKLPETTQTVSEKRTNPYPSYQEALVEKSAQGNAGDAAVYADSKRSKSPSPRKPTLEYISQTNPPINPQDETLRSVVLTFTGTYYTVQENIHRWCEAAGCSPEPLHSNRLFSITRKSSASPRIGYSLPKTDTKSTNGTLKEQNISLPDTEQTDSTLEQENISLPDTEKTDPATTQGKAILTFDQESVNLPDTESETLSTSDVLENEANNGDPDKTSRIEDNEGSITTTALPSTKASTLRTLPAEENPNYSARFLSRKKQTSYSIQSLPSTTHSEMKPD